MLEEKGSIMSRILDHYRTKYWRPRVHAELTLLEALHDSRCPWEELYKGYKTKCRWSRPSGR